MTTTTDVGIAGHGLRSEPARARGVGFRPIRVAELEQFELEGRLVDLYRSGVGLTTGGEGRNVGGSMSEGPQTSYPTMPTMPDREIAREATPAELEIAQLHEAIDGFSVLLDTLESRLRSVMRGDRPHEVGVQADEAIADRSSMVATLDTLGELLQQRNRRLALLIDRLDV